MSAIVDARKRLAHPREWRFRTRPVVPDVSTIAPEQIHAMENFDGQLTEAGGLAGELAGWIMADGAAVWRFITPRRQVRHVSDNADDFFRDSESLLLRAVS